MKKKVLSILIVLTMMIGTCMVAAAAENPSATKAQLRSGGAVRYSGKDGEVIIDAADFYTLADQLDLFKIRVVKQLGVMRTYLTRSGGDVALTSADDVYAVHRKPAAGDEADPLSLDFATILEGIAVSQSIPTDPAAYGFPAGTQLYKKADGTLTTSNSDGAEAVSVQPAEADNLSAGTAAWVNGKLLLGTGKDVSEMTGASSGTSVGTEEFGKYGINSEYTLPEDVPFAIAYVCTTAHDGVSSGTTPIFSVSSCQKLTKLHGAKYSRNGFVVRVDVYRLIGMPAGTVIKGSGGLLFY